MDKQLILDTNLDDFMLLLPSFIKGNITNFKNKEFDEDFDDEYEEEFDEELDNDIENNTKVTDYQSSYTEDYIYHLLCSEHVYNDYKVKLIKHIFSYNAYIFFKTDNSKSFDLMMTVLNYDKEKLFDFCYQNFELVYKFIDDYYTFLADDEKYDELANSNFELHINNENINNIKVESIIDVMDYFIEDFLFLDSVMGNDYENTMFTLKQFLIAKECNLLPLLYFDNSITELNKSINIYIQKLIADTYYYLDMLSSNYGLTPQEEELFVLCDLILYNEQIHKINIELQPFTLLYNYHVKVKNYNRKIHQNDPIKSNIIKENIRKKTHPVCWMNL